MDEGRLPAEFERLQEEAQEAGRRGANLGDVLQRHGGAKAPLRLRRDGGNVEYSLAETGDNAIRRVPILHTRIALRRTSGAIPFHASDRNAQYFSRSRCLSSLDTDLAFGWASPPRNQIRSHWSSSKLVTS